MPQAAKERRFRGKTTEERRQERKQRLLAAGLTVFADKGVGGAGKKGVGGAGNKGVGGAGKKGIGGAGKKGFHGVGVRDVCAAAELTERYFYESFDNLEVLFLAVYEQCVQRVRQATDAALAAEHETPEAVTRAGLRAFFGTLGDDPRIARVLLIDVLTVNADVAAQSHLVVASFAEVVGRVMVERFGGALEAGLRADILAHGLVGATIHIGVQWVFGGLAEPLEVIVEHAVVMFEAVARAVEPGSSSRAPGR